MNEKISPYFIICHCLVWLICDAQDVFTSLIQNKTASEQLNRKFFRFVSFNPRFFNVLELWLKNSQLHKIWTVYGTQVGSLLQCLPHCAVDVGFSDQH